MRDAIHYFSNLYEGDYHKILKALQLKKKYRLIEAKSQFVTIVDHNYPQTLLKLNKPPLILYYHGDLSLLERELVAVVGSRQSSVYAQKWTQRIILEVYNNDVIISGMAKGIDTVAHKSALDNKMKTVAVLGSGINYIYPKSNKMLYDELCKNHLVISEFPDQTMPRPYFFPFRNRIIAALSREVVVMQAALRSGTMTTVNEALELSVPVVVLPYRVDDIEGLGCNALIEQGASMIQLSDFDLKS